MGTPEASGIGKNAQKFIEEEFKRLSKKGRKHLVLEEVLKFHAKGATLPLEFCHLGVLWVLDSNHDGKFTLEELFSLAALCQQRSKCYQSFEYAAQLQGFCSLKLWQSMCTHDGQELFINWVCTMLLENSTERRRFWRYGAQQYLHVDTVETLHHLLRIQETLGTDFQGFTDLLQRVGEERRVMDLNDEEQDDWVPLCVVRDFIEGIFRGAHRLMADICPVEDLPQDLNDL